jgi:hypothetical protein
LNGTRTQNQTYTSKVVANLFGFGDNAINKIEYSFDQKVWNIYSGSFSLSDDTFLYCRSTDNKGNIGPTSSITLTFESNNTTPCPSPLPSSQEIGTFPTVTFAIVSLVAIAVVGAGLLVYFRRRKKE